VGKDQRDMIEQAQAKARTDVQDKLDTVIPASLPEA